MNHSELHITLSVLKGLDTDWSTGFIRGRETTLHCVTTSGPDLELSKPLTICKGYVSRTTANQ
jgi:hypothetical protein